MCKLVIFNVYNGYKVGTAQSISYKIHLYGLIIILYCLFVGNAKNWWLTIDHEIVR